MNWIDAIGWTATTIALLGVWMNNCRRRACFVLWLISNGITLGIHAAAGMWPIAAHDGAFFIMAIHGWCLWGRRAATEVVRENP